MSRKETSSLKGDTSPSLHAKRGSSGSGDRRKSGSSGDGETGGERRVSRESGGSVEHLPQSQQSSAVKKVLFSEPATVKDTSKRTSQTGSLLEHQISQGEEDSPKSQKKAVSTWRMACGMTKDKTKDLLKRWRTLPDAGTGTERPPLQEIKSNTTTTDHGWSVHVWGVDSFEESDTSTQGVATWVKRCPSEDEPSEFEKDKDKSCSLTDIQKEKLSYFFAHVFDMDRDDVIALQDIEGFTENDIFSDSPGFQDTLDDIIGDNEVEGWDTSSDSFWEWLTNRNTAGAGRILMEQNERLRHFAEWSTNSGEYLILQQVQDGFIETFIYPLKQAGVSSEGEDPSPPKDMDRLFLSIEEWLSLWGGLLQNKKNFHDLPLWLQYLPKVIFAAINKSGSGFLTKEELGAFYSSVMGFPSQKLIDLQNESFNAMTGGGDYKLTYDCYRLCFANFLFGRYPNGPGQYIFGAAQKSPPPLFPIDYSAMNTPPEDIEPFNGSLKSNRSSVIV